MPLYFNAQKNKEKRNVFSNGYFKKPKTRFISPMGGNIHMPIWDH